MSAETVRVLNSANGGNEPVPSAPLAYFVEMTPYAALVRWRGSEHPAAMFDRRDFSNAEERAQAIADELNEACS